MSAIIAPILGLIAGAVSLYVDPKDQKRTNTLLSRPYNGRSARMLARIWRQQGKTGGQGNIKTLIDSNGQLSRQVNKAETGVESIQTDIKSMLQNLGARGLATRVAQAFQASKSLTSMAAGSNPGNGRPIVEYFPKDVDGAIVDEALQGFSNSGRSPPRTRRIGGSSAKC